MINENFHFKMKSDIGSNLIIEVSTDILLHPKMIFYYTFSSFQQFLYPKFYL